MYIFGVRDNHLSDMGRADGTAPSSWWHPCGRVPSKARARCSSFYVKTETAIDKNDSRRWKK